MHAMWCYGLIKTESETFGTEYAVHEIFDSFNGVGESWTVDPVTFHGSSRDAVESALLMALNDIRRETDDQIEKRVDK